MVLAVIILSILLILSLLLQFYVFKQGIKKGMDDFLALLLANGFTFKMNAFNKQNQFIKPGGIVFVGDSITQDYNVYEYFSEYHVYNRGIGGDTTEGLKTRLNNSIFDLKPHTVVLLIGTNDLALLQTSPLKVATNIKEIIKSVKEKLPNVKIILQSIYPVNADLSPMTVLPRQNKDIKAINDLISKIDDVTYVDLYSKLELDGKLNPKYSVEGLHINEEGYELITHELKLHLK